MVKTIRQVIKLCSATVLTKIGFQVQFEHLLTRPGRNDLQFLLWFLSVQLCLSAVNMYIGGSIHCAMCVQVKTGYHCMIYNDYSLFLSWYTHGSKNRQQYVSISWQGRMERTWQSLLFPVLPRNHSVQNLQRRARKYFLFSEKFPCSDDFLHSAIWNNVTIVKKSMMSFWRLFLFPCFHLTPNFELDYSGSPSLKWQMWHFVAIRWLGSCCKRRS